MQFPEKRIKLVRTGSLKIKSLKNPSDVIKAFQDKLADSAQEFVIAIYLDSAGNMLNYSTISQGCINGACVDIADIFRIALLSCATSIIVLHNHPSGNVTPSKADVMLTSCIIEAGNIFKIEVLDHIITGPYSYYSMREKAELPSPATLYSTDINELKFSVAENI